ncbi:hypothetical protein C2S53_008399 [Perilla frutescens var. hirtella]|uniref:Tf2-1-like SH3-like domain-containing protein n=1 Tax=Perilla frutescens var. hirtella TaxID=608512 RepID=A0AAD4IS16_PERFH|nr:hypothetical protein C2S53_008399 [Perilla frutescens var. hirtella]
MTKDEALHHLRAHLEQAQQRMIRAAKKHRRDVQFEAGQHVFLKLRPYRQNSLIARANAMLAPKFYGHFLVEECVGQVAYRLRLPECSRIDPVFHVS